MAEPAVYCDASFSSALGLAGIAYTSNVLGNKRQVVRSECSQEAELRAVIMALTDHRGHPVLTVRTDSKSLAEREWRRRPRHMLRAIRKRVATEIDGQPHWHLEWTPRQANRQAHGLARSARRAAERVFA
jgi:ribonuclease HI